MGRPFATRIYGARGSLRDADSGIRRVAPTFGKTLHLTHSAKAAKDLAVESPPERLVSHMLDLHPGVKVFTPQALTVDLIDGCIYLTKEAVAAARAKHESRPSPRFYTPDFGVDWHEPARGVLEVKLEGHSGDDRYAAWLAKAKPILEGNGYRFWRVVIPANTKHPVWTNVLLLAQALLRRDLWPTADQVLAVEAACGESGISLSLLCQKLGVSPNLIPVWLVSGVVRADLFQNPIRGDLHLTAAHGGRGHLDLLSEVMQ